MDTTNTLTLADLPAALRVDVAASAVRQSHYHGLVVRDLRAVRSYFSGTPRVLVFLTGVDRDGNDLGDRFSVAEVYADRYGVSAAEFDALWDAAL